MADPIVINITAAEAEFGLRNAAKCFSDSTNTQLTPYSILEADEFGKIKTGTIKYPGYPRGTPFTAADMKPNGTPSLGLADNMFIDHVHPVDPTKANVANPVFTGTVTSPKVTLTPEGGIAIRLTNKTGAASVKGTVVFASSSTDNAFNINPTSGDMPFGVVYENGVVDGGECLVVVSGIAEVLLVNSVATTRGYIAMSSTTVAGRIDTASTVPAATAHFTEIGHTIETKIAGTDVLVKCVLHFN